MVTLAERLCFDADPTVPSRHLCPSRETLLYHLFPSCRQAQSCGLEHLNTNCMGWKFESTAIWWCVTLFCYYLFIATKRHFAHLEVTVTSDSHSGVFHLYVMALTVCSPMDIRPSRAKHSIVIIYITLLLVPKILLLVGERMVYESNIHIDQTNKKITKFLSFLSFSKNGKFQSSSWDVDGNRLIGMAAICYW